MVSSDAGSAADGDVPKIFDYFFAAYVTPQAQRLRFVKENGVQHASEIFPRDPLPGQPVALSIISNAALPIDRVAVYFTADGSEPAGERGRPTRGHVVPADLQPDQDQIVGDTPIHCWQAHLPGQLGGVLVRYRIDAWYSGDPTRRWLADVADPLAAPAPTGREFAYHVDRREAPDWVHDAIVYHIFVDRFAAAGDQPPMRDPGSLTGFYGGTLRGITENLDYLATLGVNCLWLSPVMNSPTYHGYNSTSYRDVSPRLGSTADLRDLIAQAHARGMRVLLDFVANHTSNEHPAFLDAQQRDDSRYADWYAFDPSYRNGYLTYHGVSGMPVLKTDAEVVRSYLVEAARHWLTDFGADGLRLDNVSGPTHAFWTLFQEGVKASAPDALTLAEITGGMDDIATYGGRLDACMDFPLAKLTRRVFAQRSAPLDELLALLEPHEAAFSPAMARARLLDNHDMHRFLWLAEGDTRRLKLALTFLMVLPGFPILFYGTEVGLSQRAGPPGKDAYAREPMPWGSGQRADVLQHTRWLIARRAAFAALRRGQMARVPVTLATDTADAAGAASQTSQVGALARWTDREASIVVFNNGDAAAHVSIMPRDLPFPWEPPPGQNATVEAWLLTSDGITRLPAADLAATLPALSALMILRTVGA
jgi:cyclomaltodextrinase / maltogenic alpha-amylase / neopullulanase